METGQNELVDATIIIKRAKFPYGTMWDLIFAL